jgi:CheY-like chemotaxis protein
VLILIIDDEAYDRNGFVRLLEDMGHKTCWASTGEAGLALMRTEKPDLVILDLMMPGMDGWTVAREKAMDPAIRGIDLVICTGMPVANARAGAQKVVDAFAGALVVLEKPVSESDLETVIRRVAERRQRLSTQPPKP